jgi:hypothetical protein
MDLGNVRLFGLPAAYLCRNSPIVVTKLIRR